MKKKLYYFIHAVVKAIIAPSALLWVRPKMLPFGKNASKKIEGGAILLSNHSSFLDPFYLQTAVLFRRHHFLTLKEFFNTRFKRFLFNAFLCIPVDRNAFGMDCFYDVLDCLAQDELVVIFPEGRINRDDSKIEDFKSGAVLMAAKSGKPIVLMYIAKQKSILSRMHFVISEKFFVPKTVGGKPITAVQINEYTKMLHDKMTAMKNFAEGRNDYEKNDIH